MAMPVSLIEAIALVFCVWVVGATFGACLCPQERLVHAPVTAMTSPRLPLALAAKTIALTVCTWALAASGAEAEDDTVNSRLSPFRALAT